MRRVRSALVAVAASVSTVVLVDHLYGASGDDTLTGGSGADHLDGGSGYVDVCNSDALDIVVNCES
jgi:Ca2+-binding RTX toxin-like protein